MSKLLVMLVVFALSNFAFAKCDPVPYSVQAKEVYGGIKINPAATLTGKPSSVVGAVGFVSSMYAAMGPTVLREVLDNYSCRISEKISTDPSLSDSEKQILLEALSTSIDNIGAQAVIYFLAFKNNNITEIQNIKPTTKNTTPLLNEEKIPQTIVNSALSSIKDSDFLIENQYEAFLKAKLNGFETTACGKYIRAALAKNAGAVQHLAASAKSTLTTYLSSSPSGVKSAYTKIFIEAASTSLISVPQQEDEVKVFEECVK